MANITITPGAEARHYRESRNVELSTLKFIEDSLAIDWSDINIVKSWTQLEKVKNPVICVILDDTEYARAELGNTNYRKTYVFNIDLFAKSDAQRLDLSDWLMDILNPGWVYYEISQSSGNNRSLVYTDTGRCRLESVIVNTKIDLGKMGDVKDKYRQSIVVSVTIGCNHD